MMSLRRAGLPLAALLVALGLLALGIWQVERRAWKHDLITAVDSRIHAAPMSAPGPQKWDHITQQNDAYRRITVSGVFQHDKEVLVKAVTERGAGFWVVTPLDTGEFQILINRGFVPPEKTDIASRAGASVAEPVTVTGLLRITEPKGGFLRDNEPKTGRWFSRDVSMIAADKGLANAAPYFIDADASPNAGGYPIGGMTVVKFNDHHMIYALTWFGLAGLAIFFAYRLWTTPRRKDKDGE
jgi:surfeit locus 1 family protein